MQAVHEPPLLFEGIDDDLDGITFAEMNGELGRGFLFLWSFWLC